MDFSLDDPIFQQFNTLFPIDDSMVCELFAEPLFGESRANPSSVSVAQPHAPHPVSEEPCDELFLADMVRQVLQAPTQEPARFPEQLASDENPDSDADTESDDGYQLLAEVEKQHSFARSASKSPQRPRRVEDDKWRHLFAYTTIALNKYIKQYKLSDEDVLELKQARRRDKNRQYTRTHYYKHKAPNRAL
eukprot:m.50391 g.50391  ORF g.50391 m.50391 type:complete len:191 (-) comp48116_c0_seq1:162-734(-)